MDLFSNSHDQKWEEHAYVLYNVFEVLTQMERTPKVFMSDGSAVPVWVLKKASELSGYTMNSPAAYKNHYDYHSPFKALCKLIEETQEPPADPIRVAAREGLEKFFTECNCKSMAEKVRSGEYPDNDSYIKVACHAIEAYLKNQEEGFDL